MIVHRSIHSKRRSFSSIVILMVIGLVSSILMSCSKEEKGEKHDDMKNITTTDASKTLPPAIRDKSNISIIITKEGEVLIQNEKVDLDSIPSRIEDLKNKFPDEEIIVYKHNDCPPKILTEVSNLVSADKIINVVVAVAKEN